MSGKYRRRWFISFLLVSLIAFVSGCAGLDNARPVDEAAYAGTIKLACIGNSITFGHGIENRDVDSYPAQLDRMLSAKWDVRNFGVSGATLLKQGNKPYWEERAFTEALAFEPDVVVIKLGTNDSKPVNWEYADQFVNDYLALIEQFRSLESHPRVWICLPVPAYGVRWDIRNEVITGEIIPLIREIANAADVPLIDLFEPLSGKEALFPDMIHPNVEGAGLIASEICNTLTGTH